jgi:hypothetical protein
VPDAADPTTAKVLAFGGLIEVAARAAQARGAVGRWTVLLHRLGEIKPPAEDRRDQVERMIELERWLWIRALGSLQAPVLAKVVVSLKANRHRAELPAEDPWYALDSTRDRSVQAMISREEDTLERAFLLAYRSHLNSRRFSDLEQAYRCLSDMALVRERLQGRIAVSDHEAESASLWSAVTSVLSEPACQFLASAVKQRFGELAGDPILVPARISEGLHLRDEGTAASAWITAGDWTHAGAFLPDVNGVWFVDPVQRVYRRLQLKTQTEIERAQAEEIRKRKAAEENEAREAAARKAEEDQRAREAEAEAIAREAAANARRLEEEARIQEHRRYLAERERQVLIRAEIENAQIATQIRLEDAELDDEIAALLWSKQIEPTPGLINRERKARGRGASTAMV